jgi:hypothetical protein
MAFEHILDDRVHCLWPHGRGIAFPDAGDAIRRGQLDKGPVPPPPARGGRGNGENLQICKVHLATLLGLGRALMNNEVRLAKA